MLAAWSAASFTERERLRARPTMSILTADDGVYTCV